LKEEYSRGIAFIMEGTTEKVFYRSFLKWISENNQCIFERGEDLNNADIYFDWDNGNEKILIKFNVVGAVTQVSNSGKWFSTKCAGAYKIPWKVFLCYDTDNYDDDISKFYQDDWKVLRGDIKKAKAEEIIDLAASADIEDIMLCDLNGICRFLNISIPNELKGRKGKAKMKGLYRSCGNTYHEGDRAEGLISTLDFQKIVDKSPLNLQSVIDMLKKPQYIVDKCVDKT